MRILKSIILLILAAAITIGCFWIVDNYPYIFRTSYSLNNTSVDTASALTGRIYSLERAISEEAIEDYETDLNKEVTAYLKAHSGGSSSSGGGYYYSNNDGGDWSDGDGGSGGSSGGSSGGGWYEIDMDDTIYNYCSTCGTSYTGAGDCPNPDCPSNNRY